MDESALGVECTLERLTDGARQSSSGLCLPGREFINHICDRLSNDFLNYILSPIVSVRQVQR